MEYIDFLAMLMDFAFIKVVEATFILVISMSLAKIKMNLHKSVLIILVMSIIGYLLLPIGSNDIVGTLVYLLIFGVIIKFAYWLNLRKFLVIYGMIFVSMLIMIFTGTVGLLPLLYILGEEVSIIQQSVFMVILCSIPSRVFEYIIAHIVFMKFGGLENEQETKRIG